MRHNWLQFLLVPIFFGMLLPVQAQEDVEINLQSETSPDGMALRWTFTFETIPENGFLLYRRRDNGSFEPLTEEPIQMMSYEEMNEEYDSNFVETMRNQFEDYGELPLTPDSVQENELQDDPFELALLNLFLSEDIRRAEAMGSYYLDEDVEEGASYTYELRSVGANGEEQVVDSTGPITHTTEPSIPVPGEPNYSTYSNRIHLNWPHQSGYYFYHVYRATRENGELQQVTEEPIRKLEPGDQEEESARRVQFNDEDAQVGDTYWYAIRIQDQNGVLGEPSDRVRIEYTDEFPPPSPLSVQVEEGEDALVVNWLPVDADDVAGYNVYRAASSQDDMEQVNGPPVEGTEYEDTSIAPGTDHIYRVTAVDDAGNESEMGFRATGKVTDTTPPEPVSGLEAETEEGEVHLSWEPSEADDLHSYIIQRAFQEEDERTWMQVNMEVIEESEFVDTMDPSVSNVLLYRVRAVDTSFNESDWSDPISARLPDVTPPPAPILQEAIPREHQVQLNWEPRRPDDVAGMFPERTPAGQQSWNRLTEDPVDGSEYTDENLAGGSQYRYRLIAVDDAGNESEPSNTALATPVDVTAPSAPENISTSSTPQGMEISWEASDSTDLSGYFVYRREEGEWTQVSPLLTEPRFIDSDVMEGETHEYAIEALDESGNRSSLAETGEVTFDP